jgi:hypothetical protein
MRLTCNARRLDEGKQKKTTFVNPLLHVELILFFAKQKVKPRLAKQNELDV